MRYAVQCFGVTFLADTMDDKMNERDTDQSEVQFTQSEK